ncbi:MAG: RDD family protein [Longimicrobiaceae bacterium]
MDHQHPSQPSETPRQAPGYPPPAPGQPYAVSSVAGPDIVKRGLALFIDFVIVGCGYFALSLALGIPLGWMGRLVAAAVAAAAVLVRDVAFQGVSPGKKILGMAAVGPDGAPVTLQQSVMRNSTLALGYVNSALASIPILGFLSLLGIFVVLAVFAYEIYLVATNQPRLGDRLAGGTRVIFQGQPAIAI